MAAKFVLKKGSSGKFRFNLLATNGQVIITSEAYESRAAAMRGIASVQKNAPDAGVDDQTGTGKPAATKAVPKTEAKKTAAKRAAAKKTAAKQAPAKEQALEPDDARDDDEGTHYQDVAAGDADSPIQLGTCHYGGLDELATTMAVRDDGTGWIGICEEHRDQAEQDGFSVREEVVS